MMVRSTSHIEIDMPYHHEPLLQLLTIIYGNWAVESDTYNDFLRGDRILDDSPTLIIRKGERLQIVFEGAEEIVRKLEEYCQKSSNGRY